MVRRGGRLITSGLVSLIILFVDNLNGHIDEFTFSGDLVTRLDRGLHIGERQVVWIRTVGRAHPINSVGTALDSHA